MRLFGGGRSNNNNDSRGGAGYPGARRRRTSATTSRSAPTPTSSQQQAVSQHSALQPQQPSNNFDAQVTTLIPAEVRMISGCHSEQTSADVSNIRSASVANNLPNPAGRSGGACTSALLDILYQKQHSNISFQKLLLELRSSLANKGFDQVPQLTSSRRLDNIDTTTTTSQQQDQQQVETPFTLVNGTNSSGQNSSGTCRALLVGINYVGQNGQLSGCQNDVWNVYEYITKIQGYHPTNVLVLVDDHTGKYHSPTRSNIIKALQQLVAQSVAGDSVYFHYSGHGGLLEPTSNLFKCSQKEYDETLYPLDHERRGHIRDFSLFNNFVKPMPSGVLVTCVLDCCHCGSVLDLPYSYQPTSAGTIRMKRSMNNLSNLALLYILAGGMLHPPMLFGDVTQNIQDTTGVDNLDDLQGAGNTMEEGDEGGGGGGEDYDGDNDGGGGEFDDATGANNDAVDDVVPENEYGDGYGGGTDGDGIDTTRDAAGYNGDNNYTSAADADPYGDGGGGYEGFGGDDIAGGGGGGDFGDGADDIDCSCLADVLQNLLDQ